MTMVEDNGSVDPQWDIVIAQWNIATLLASSLLFTVLYVQSVQPAKLSLRGHDAYRRCKWYRIAAGAFMTLACANYIVYYFYPLPVLHQGGGTAGFGLGIPQTFPWPCCVSAVIAATIGLPFGYLMWIGMRDAGDETMTPKPEHGLYSGGIYEHMRHPQAVGEFPIWWTMAFLAHSPFLVLFTFVYLPIWYYFAIVEERDLVLRYGSAYEEYRQRVGWFPQLENLPCGFCRTKKVD